MSNKCPHGVDNHIPCIQCDEVHKGYFVATQNTELQKAVEEADVISNSPSDYYNGELGLSVHEIELLRDAAKQLQQVNEARLKEIMHTCIHHNDAERAGAPCPVCLKATHGTLLVALDYNRAERDDLKSKLQQIQKEKDELSEKLKISSIVK